MITAKEAKDLTLKSDKGLSDLIEVLEECIRESAELGEFEVIFDTENSLDESVVHQAVLILRESGYHATMDVVRTESETEYWDAILIKINWRMA